MARVIALASTPLNTRKAGSLFYPTGIYTRARASPIPLLPITSPQSSTQNYYSTAVAYWQTLSASVKATWDTPNVTGALGLNWFVMVQTQTLSWGLPMYPEPLTAPTAIGNVILWAYTDATTGRAMLLTVPTTSNPGQGLTYYQIYVQVSALIASYESGYSGIAGYGAATPSGYVFLGTVGPMANSTTYAVDITDAIIALYGQMPTERSAPGPVGFFFGSIFDSLVYPTDGAGTVFQTTLGPQLTTQQTQMWTLGPGAFSPPFSSAATFTPSPLLYL